MFRSSLLSTVSTVHWSQRGLANLKRLSATSGLTSIAAPDHTQCSLENITLLGRKADAVKLRKQQTKGGAQ
jgi:hypothetical protein